LCANASWRMVQCSLRLTPPHRRLCLPENVMIWWWTIENEIALMSKYNYIWEKKIKCWQ
jgi:hypothetical protein